MTGAGIGPISPSIGGGLGSPAPLVIKGLQGGGHGGLIDAILDLKVVRLLGQASGQEIVGARGREEGKVHPPEGIPRNKWRTGIRSFGGNTAGGINQDAGGGVMHFHAGARIRREVSDLLVCGAITEMVELDAPQDGSRKGEAR